MWKKEGEVTGANLLSIKKEKNQKLLPWAAGAQGELSAEVPAEVFQDEKTWENGMSSRCGCQSEKEIRIKGH